MPAEKTNYCQYIGHRNVMFWLQEGFKLTGMILILRLSMHYEVYEILTPKDSIGIDFSGI